ncbi:MAG TPA: MerR family DNA-binding transcriptional regulator [Microthrixaceae bacterium]|jgi:excisionase family DNA binding protein|nr:MerR family DNA-binding transcriptional regulator [Microthrixaceae bacterium]
MTTDTLVSIGTAALLLGVSVDTMRRWEIEGRITSTRTPGNQRRYELADIERLRTGGDAA